MFLKQIDKQIQTFSLCLQKLQFSGPGSNFSLQIKLRFLKAQIISLYLLLNTRFEAPTRRFQ